MTDDRIEQAEGRFRALVAKWLAELPADGWEGTSHQLGDDLAAFGKRHRLYAFVPTCPARKVAALADLRAAGFALTHHRTKSERTVRFTRTR
jgi:hypothetical protein